MRSFALPLALVIPIVVATGCEVTDEVLDRLLVEGPFGASFDFDPASLPEGIDPADVRLEAFDVPAELPSAITGTLSASLVLFPEGIQLSAPATLVVPVGSWNATSGREDPFNPQITDAVTQANVKVLGEAPAIAMANLYQATAQALSNAAHNATSAQQQSWLTAQAATTQGIALLYGVDSPAQAPYLGSLMGSIPGSWNTFAGNPAGNAYLQGAGILPVGAGQSTAAAAQAASSSGRGGEFEYATFDWVETASGEWDARVTTAVFESYTLVKLQLDGDGNGIHDVLEGPDDLDGDGLWSPEDWDNDGDRVADAVELWEDTDSDGLPAMNDPDRDGSDPADGVAECGVSGPCACGFRAGLVRVLCVEGKDLSCGDTDFGWGPVQHEIVPQDCPDPEGGAGATCDGLGGTAVHYYGAVTDPAAAMFCSECVEGTVAPAAFCGPPQ